MTDSELAPFSRAICIWIPCASRRETPLGNTTITFSLGRGDLIFSAILGRGGFCGRTENPNWEYFHAANAFLSNTFATHMIDRIDRPFAPFSCFLRSFFHGLTKCREVIPVLIHGV